MYTIENHLLHLHKGAGAIRDARRGYKGRCLSPLLPLQLRLRPSLITSATVYYDRYQCSWCCTLTFVIWPSLFTPCRCVPWSISSMQMMLCIYLFCFRGETLTSSLVNGRWEGVMLTMFLLMDLVSLMLPPVVQKTWAKTFHIPGGSCEAGGWGSVHKAWTLLHQ